MMILTFIACSAVAWIVMLLGWLAWTWLKSEAEDRRIAREQAIARHPVSHLPREDAKWRELQTAIDQWRGDFRETS